MLVSDLVSNFQPQAKLWYHNSNGEAKWEDGQFFGIFASLVSSFLHLQAVGDRHHCQAADKHFVTNSPLEFVEMKSTSDVRRGLFKAYLTLKHANFVFSDDSDEAVLKLVDFGLSRLLTPKEGGEASNFGGTLYYMAPEVLLRRPHCTPCDMWSVGVIVYYLLSGRAPFLERTTEGTKEVIISGLFAPMTGQPWEGVSDVGKEFVRTLFNIHPAKRPTAEEALKDPWVIRTNSERRRDLANDVLQEVIHDLREFTKLNATQRAAACFLIYSKGAEKSGEKEKQFKALDRSGEGTISKDDIKDVLEHLGSEDAEDEAKQLVKDMDMTGDGYIHHSEFMAATFGAKMMTEETTVKAVFDRFDANKDGFIDIKELRAIVGDSFCGQPTEDILDELDLNKDGKLDLHEFQHSEQNCPMGSQLGCATGSSKSLVGPGCKH